MASIKTWLRLPCRRRGKALSLALLGACAAGSRTTADSQEQPRGIRIFLGADDIEYSDDEKTALLAGHVHLRAWDLPGPVSEVNLETDRLRMALEAGDIEAPGGAIVRAEGIEISGSQLHYNLRSHDFRAQDARLAARVPLEYHDVGVYATCKSVESEEGRIELRQARLTTCDRERERDQHYALNVRRARILPDKNRVIVYGGGIELYGVSTPLIPRMRHSLSKRDFTGEFDVALPGYSKIEGVYIPFNRRFTPPENPIQARMNLRANKHYIVSGRFLTSYERPGLRTWAELVRREEVEDDVTELLVHDAFPELGVELLRARGSSRLSAQFVGGHYRDENTFTQISTKDYAATLKVGWDWKKRRPDGISSLWAGVGARGSLYGRGDTYRTVNFHMGGAKALWPGALGRIGLRHHLIGGNTPFEFDDIDIRTELYGGVHAPVAGPWAASLDGRYDVDITELRDYRLGLYYQHHCLTWSVHYNKAFERISIGVDLSDFIPGGRRTPKRRDRRPPAAVGPAVAQSPRHQDLSKLPATAVFPAEPLATVPTEFALGRSHQQRAPDAIATSRLRPPPSLGVASAAPLW